MDGPGSVTGVLVSHGRFILARGPREGLEDKVTLELRPHSSVRVSLVS